MPNKSISMNKIRQVLRCYASGNGTKSISSMLSISRNTIKKYLHIYQKSGLNLKDILSLDDSCLCSLFQEQEKQPEEMSSRYKELHSLFPNYSKRLKKKGVTRNQLFKEYQSTHSDGYARSRFCTYLQAYLALSHPIAHLEHKAGDKMYIDYAGDKLSLKVRDNEAIQLANSKIDEIRNGFSDWLQEQSPEFQSKLTDMYNRKFNCFVRPTYNGTHQSFPDLDLKRLGIPDLYKSQKDAVWMLKQNGGGIADHEVLRP